MAKTTRKTTAKTTGPASAGEVKPEATPAKAASKKATVKKTAVKKAPAKKATTKKAVAKKTATKKAAAPARKPAATGNKTPRISTEQRQRMIAEAAYLRAESLGFCSDPKEDWLTAEAEVDARLAAAGIRVAD